MIETDPTLTKLATLPMAERLVTAIMSLIDPAFWTRPRLCIAAAFVAEVIVAAMLAAAIVILVW